MKKSIALICLFLGAIACGKNSDNGSGTGAGNEGQSISSSQIRTMIVRTAWCRTSGNQIERSVFALDGYFSSQLQNHTTVGSWSSNADNQITLVVPQGSADYKLTLLTSLDANPIRVKLSNPQLLDLTYESCP